MNGYSNTYWGHDVRQIEALLIGLGAGLDWQAVERGSLNVENRRVVFRDGIGDRVTISRDVIHGVKARG